MMTISQNMARISEQMMNLNEENIKWLKRLDKRMYYINQSLMSNVNGSPIQHETGIERSPEKERVGSSLKPPKED